MPKFKVLYLHSYVGLLDGLCQVEVNTNLRIVARKGKSGLYSDSIGKLKYAYFEELYESIVQYNYQNSGFLVKQLSSLN